MSTIGGVFSVWGFEVSNDGYAGTNEMDVDHFRRHRVVNVRWRSDVTGDVIVFAKTSLK